MTSKLTGRRWLNRAVVPTLVANAFFVPRYLLPKVETPSTAGPVPHAESAAAHSGKRFEALRRHTQERQVELRMHILVGHPADPILTWAAPHGVDLTSSAPYSW